MNEEIILTSYQFAIKIAIQGRKLQCHQPYKLVSMKRLFEKKHTYTQK